MFPDPNSADRINSFALVSYIPEPLAGFLDKLRQELVPNCFLRAHVTILPPRPLLSTPEEAWHQLCSAAPRFAPFAVELQSVELFPISDVIYISIGKGSDEMRAMYASLNNGGLEYHETFRYHPHVTLAQQLRPDELDELVCVARQRWAEFRHLRQFRVETLTFVQNSRRNKWIDLGDYKLGQDGSGCRLLDGNGD
jgi:2'-5' RNA ligase